MSTTGGTHGGSRRLAAIAAILLILAVVIGTLVRFVDDPLRVIAELVLLAVIVGAGWIALTRAGTRRVIATVVAGMAIVALIISIVNAEGSLGVSLVIRIAVIVAAVALAKYALGNTLAALKQSETPGTPVPAAQRGVLFMNLKSGGGEGRAVPPRGRVRAARDRTDRAGTGGWTGSRPCETRPRAARSTCWGWPAVTAPRRWSAPSPPSSGSRWWSCPPAPCNHLALDLGLDREDVVGALDAYGEAVERTMDLADVNGSVFVNNVSLGLYAAIVRSPEYRDAKVDTTLSTLPQVLGPQTEPFDLRFERRRQEQGPGRT